ncbi:hypothetical protein AM493_00185 [Flavobacterium akiainvivens]|uniref:Lipoprotein n=1 Tax=Flavobacterium akiainvivens TaxID=1202724 RepID=A0A0M8M6Y6_9FLAO|nr:hypothetical protein [Flavobacterium akiainvivens]KOS04633.1 hypothetical protein AM493_00185 [Flavobacterium akiainvivens]SFQ65657.1 hypothetical protein SAMN05444144_11287 [Flavobacterium akiainvivens]
MKNLKVMLGAAVVAVALTSCKDEAKMTAEKNVDTYVVYVDSVNNLDAATKAKDWEAIQAGYEARLAEAEAALATLENEAKAKERIDDSKVKYDGVKAQAEAEAAKQKQTEAAASGNALADSLFGAGTVVGNDMTFAWVNKDNILSVYQNFYETFKTNKDSYSRQDLDKIKAWYEALDSRKNTVEKEGLTSSDNNKIAGLKLKFAPSFKWERMTAKSEENKDAKEKAN